MDALPQLALRSQTVLGGVYFLFFVTSWPFVIGLLKDYYDKDKLAFNCIPKPSDFTRQRCYDFYTSSMSPLLTPLDFAGITYGVLGFIWVFFILAGAMILRRRERSEQREQSEQRERREQREQREQFRDRIEQRFKWTFICHVFSQLAVLGVMMGLFCGYQSFHFPAEYKCSQANTTLTTLNKVEVKITCNDLRYKEKRNLNIAIITIMAISITLCLLTAIHLAVTWKTFLKQLLGYILEREDGNLVEMDSVDPEQGRERSTSGNVEASGAGSQSHHNQGDFDLINQIRQRYTGEGWLAPFPWREEFHFHIDNIFTRLVMVNRKKGARATGTRNVVDMFAIFQPHDECAEPKKVLIEGKPGMGKTTYCNKVAYDWATKKRKAEDCFPDFQLVLSLKCRDIGNESDLWDAIDDQLLPREIQEDEREKFFEFIRQNQSHVLLVLDGLDELPTSELQKFSEIIQGRLLPGCHVVVTARQEAGIPMRKVCDTLLEIEGFTLRDAKVFIAKYFKTKENLAEKLLHQLDSDKNLREMVANPLTTALLCVVCEDFQGIPQRRTQLYLEIVECVLRRYRKKKGLPLNSEDLTEVHKEPLKHLGSIALDGLREGNMYFAEKQLGSRPHDLPGYEFLSVQPGSSKRRPSVSYAFLHRSFQELFAAFYICCQLLSKEMSPEILVDDTRYFRGLKQVLVFTSGMLALKSEETAVAFIKSIANEVNKDELTTDYFPVALECIKECKKEQRSDFYEELARTFGSCLKVHTVDLFRKGIDDACGAVLGLALKTNTTLTVLYLNFNNLGHAAAETLADVLKTNTTLTELDLTGNNLGHAAAEALADGLKTNVTLTKLYLSDNNLGPAAAEALADALNVNRTLTELSLYENDFSGPVVEKLIMAHGDRVLIF